MPQEVSLPSNLTALNNKQQQQAIGHPVDTGG